MTENTKISLDAKRFAAVALAASSEATRDYLCGVHLEEKEGQLVAVATDGHILLYSVVSPKGKGAETLPDVRLTPTAPIVKASSKGKAESLRLELISPRLWQWSTLDDRGRVLEMGQTEAMDRVHFPEAWPRTLAAPAGTTETIAISGVLLGRVTMAAKLARASLGSVPKADGAGFLLRPTSNGTGVFKLTAPGLSGGVMPLRMPEDAPNMGAGVNIHD